MKKVKSRGARAITARWLVRSASLGMGSLVLVGSAGVTMAQTPPPIPRPCNDVDYPVHIWRQSSLPGSVPQWVNLNDLNSVAGMPQVSISILPGISGENACDPAFAPKVIILSDINIDNLNDEPTRPYWKHWWVFRPDGKDIASIDFKGDASPGMPNSRGRVYQLTIGRIGIVGSQVVGATWPATSAIEETLEIDPQDTRVRHLGSLETHSDGLINSLDSTSKPLTDDGSFKEFIPGTEPPEPAQWTNVRVRAAVSGDFGSYSGNDLLRLQARRITGRVVEAMGNRPDQTLDQYLNPDERFSLAQLQMMHIGDYPNVTGPGITNVSFQVQGNVGVITAGQIGDDGLPLFATLRPADPGRLRTGWVFEDYQSAAGATLLGPEPNNMRASEGWVLDQSGLRFDLRGSNEEKANRQLNEASRKYEIRRITTAELNDPAVPPLLASFFRTSGVIEGKGKIISAHGSIGRVEAGTRLAQSEINATNGSIDYVIGRRGVGGINLSVAAEGDANAKLRVISGFGGVSLIAGLPGTGPQPSLGGDLHVEADYADQQRSSGNSFFGRDRFDPITGLPKRMDGGVSRVLAITDPVTGIGGNFGVSDLYRPQDGPSPFTGAEQYRGEASGSIITLSGFVEDPFLTVPEGELDRVYFQKDMAGSINFLLASNVDNFGLFKDRTVWVGRHFANEVRISNHSISSSTNLGGQVISNVRNLQGWWIRDVDQNTPGQQDEDRLRIADWAAGLISVGSTLGGGNGPAYTLTSWDSGGGALGTAPFRHHRQDSEPAQIDLSLNASQRFPNTLGFTGQWFGGLPGTRPPGTIFAHPIGLFNETEPQPRSPSLGEWSTMTRLRSRLFEGLIGEDNEVGQEVGAARVRFYGPLEVGTPSSERPVGYSIVAVEFSPDPAFAPGTVVDKTSSFQAWIGGPTPPAPGQLVSPVHPTQRPTVLRDVIVRAKCGVSLPKGYYRVIRWEDRLSRPGNDNSIGLRCRYVTPDAGNSRPPSVYPFAHYFRLATSLRADVAGANQATEPDGEITADDIIVFLGWYFANHPRADVAGPNQSTTPDNEITADDIIVFLGWYFGLTERPDESIPPCPQPLNGGDGGGEGGGSGEGEGSSQGARSAGPLAGSPESAPQSSGPQTRAQRIANMQAMIDAETNPQRRALLQAALQLLQSAPTPVPSPTPAPSPAPGTDDR